MEASSSSPSTKFPTPKTLSFEPNAEKIKQNLLKKGVFPTPKIIHTLRKKEIQKYNRKTKKTTQHEKPLTESQEQEISEQAHFQTIKNEYRQVKKVLTSDKNENLMVGKPWERLEINGLKELGNRSKEYGGEKLKGEYLVELSEILAKRNKHWLLDEDIEAGEWMESREGRKLSKKREVGEAETIQFLVKRLSGTDLSMRDWKFSKMMQQSGLPFTERQLLSIVEGLGAVGCWKHALSVVEWVYNLEEFKHHKSRFVYTKLLAVLGKARKHAEALQIFNLMREDCRIYPDMPAYHSISVTLGQAGLVKELTDVIECMRQKPTKRIRNTRSKDWDPCLEPDVVVYNAVLNACVPSRQWKGVSWVMEQMRKSGLQPNGATYGLAMECDLLFYSSTFLIKFLLPRKKVYVLVRAFWEEGKVNEAVEAVRDMERRGVVGTASVYYELACCLCRNGRWKDAMLEVEKLKKLRLTKPLEVAFTGMIMSCMDGGHVGDCISVFEQMDNHCSPNIGTINAMLKVYGRNDMFAKAQEMFERTKRMESGFSTVTCSGGSFLTPDAFTYSSILEASASAQQWEYFEYVYKEMALGGYQLDQNKHAWLLVEASKAGKIHLLEHAFDMILEEGEIPHPTFFTEMVCQASAEHNYERAVILLNSMAHASYQVSEKQWTDIFMESRDRIGKDGLRHLFDKLCRSNVVTEATITNLLKSLQSICGLSSPKDLTAFSSLTVIRSPGDDSHDIIMDGESFEQMKASPTEKVDGNLNSKNNGGVVKSDVFPVYQTNSNAEDCVAMAERSSSICGISDNSIDFGSTVPSGCVDCSSASPVLGVNSQDSIEETLDLLTSHVDGSSGPDLPSASEILKRWRESRNKDGVFLPFK
ncbi:hypothetical protein IFM89_011353 [Coptis chinensis]|uniref:Pentatricopeptide repeat-containing protein n=1 Tax=Coptis chinensis TaxID=261450 RepID=A0A835LQ28_9MAGN|nr:hypothetical protein IFM89_011353 [Coptis chinensis]